MENDNIQKELFEFETQKKQPRRFGQFFQKADFTVSLNAERLVFTSIGVIMLLVVSFALGVERGKSVSSDQAERNVQAITQAAAQPRISAVTQAQQAVKAKPVNTAAVAMPKDKIQPPAAQKARPSAQLQVTDDKSKPYTIVAAAFSKEAFAVAEANRLKANGIEAFVYHGEPYYLACVGAFANKESAQKTLNKVKQIHRDAYVRVK